MQCPSQKQPRVSYCSPSIGMRGIHVVNLSLLFCLFPHCKTLAFAVVIACYLYSVSVSVISSGVATLVDVCVVVITRTSPSSVVQLN